MNPSAWVDSVKTIVDFRDALCVFRDLAKDALSTNDMEITRTVDWVSSQVDFWKKAIRKAEDDVFQAKQDLARKKMMRIGDRKQDTTDEEKILARALARLEYAQEKLKHSKHWERVLPEEVREYEGPARQLKSMMEHDVPKMIAILEQKIAALEAYLHLHPPETKPAT